METYSFYIIKCKNKNIIDTYIGHTNNIENRFRQHLERCDNLSNPKHLFKIYSIIRDTGGFDNWDIEVLFTHICDFTNARIIEQELIDQYHTTLNTYRAYTDDETRRLRHLETTKMWRQSNKEYRAEYERNQYNTNEDWKKRKINSSKKYYNNNKESCKIYKDNRYNANKVKILMECEIYRNENRDEINRRARERYHRKKEQKLMMLEDKH
jgi:hypothetical protein